MVNEAVRDIEMSRGRSETELSPRSFARSDKRSQNTFGDSQSAFADKIDPAAEKYYGLTPYNSMANNPFTFNDPEGDDFGLTLITAVTIGLLANGINNVNHGANFFDNWVETVFWSSFAAVGAYGIGGAFGGLGTLGTEAARAGTHAAFSGLVSHWQGGEFWHGAVSGGVGSGVGSGIHAGANSLGWGQQATNVAMVGGGAISGGFGASISGGDFWHGFGTAATTGLMNHVLHNRYGKNIYEEQSGTIYERAENYAGEGYGITSTTSWEIKYNVFNMGEDWVLEVSASVFARADGMPKQTGILNGYMAGELRVTKFLNNNNPVIQNQNNPYSYVGSARVVLPDRGHVKYSLTGSTAWGRGHVTTTVINIPMTYRPFLYPILETNRRRR